MIAKFKVYEVTRVRNDRKDEYFVEYLFADYADAVVKFKELIAEEKKVDWIEEALKNGDCELTEQINLWGIYVEHFLDTYRSKVEIIEKEVF